ncbi:Sulfotransferase family cytosolic 1B member 1-like protein [Leptotrombidium deliense]|uniref:Sulfotransferase family cytosolic 1B member 1-like protein n=1 Tax=Leptotrombidium deliense TaxID=299467 RepID=A0A443SSQ8_9ACAR|nr:Sulfotransferase family cytosolic 1B member 1-like protein [Leptotrombidium deliense]
MATSSVVSFILSKTSVNLLYDNALFRFLFTEENGSVWNGFRNPYTKNNVVKLAKNELCANDDTVRKEYINSIPFAKMYKGLLLQGYCISPKFLQSLENMEIRQSDVFVISYPRSGTTWTEQILSLLFSKDCEQQANKPLHDRVVHLEVGRCVGQRQYLEKLQSPRLMATHLPYDRCPRQLRNLNCKFKDSYFNRKFKKTISTNHEILFSSEVGYQH